MRDEEYVRGVWAEVGIQWGKLEGVRFGMAHAAGIAIPLHGYETENEIWSAAAEFTRERLEQIRQVEEEIAWLEHYLGGAVILERPEICREPEASVLKRIIAREQTALAELRRGMK